MTSQQTTSTAEFPLVPKAAQAAILDVLEKQSSLLMVVQTLPDLGLQLDGELSKLGEYSINIEDTVNQLLEADENEMNMLVHTMSPSMVRSVIQGTVAYDTAQDTIQSHPSPRLSDPRTPGVYVIGLRSQDDGSFLSKSEITQVANGIRQYILGCDVINRVAAQNRNYMERKRVRWVASVDGAYSSNAWRFNEHDPKFSRLDDVSGLEATVEMLERRCLSTVTDANIRQKQSPLYVGCSGHLHKRMTDYQLHKHLFHINRPLGITISVAKLVGSPLEPVVRVAIRTWEQAQLAVAEQLVLSLADGLVAQRGFNRREAGTNSPCNTANEYDEARAFVMRRSHILGDNLVASIDEMHRRADFLKLLQDVDGQINTLVVEAKEVEEAVDQTLAEPPAMSFEEIRDRMTALRDAQELELHRMKTQERANQIYLDVLDVLHPELAGRVRARAEAKDDDTAVPSSEGS